MWHRWLCSCVIMPNVANEPRRPRHDATDYRRVGSSLTFGATPGSTRTSEYGAFSVTPQYDRQPLWLAGPNDSLDPVQRLLQYVPVEEQQRRERLVLSGRGHVFLDGQMRQKSVDMAFAQFTRMRTGVKQSEAANPVDVGLFSAWAVMPGPQNLHHPVV